MSLSFLLLHGIENHREPPHWQFWLAARLQARGHQVLYPDLPDPDAPSYTAWKGALRRQLAKLGGEERVVVCHSLACLLWFKAASDLDDGARIDRLLLVSPPASERIPEAGATFRLASLDAAAVRGSVRGELAIACSDDDPYNPRGAQRLYASPLGVTAWIFEGAGHITPDSGFGPWPFAEDWCLGKATV